MNSAYSPLSNGAVTSNHISRLMNVDISILNLTSVQQCIIDDIDELSDEFLMINDKCLDRIVKFAAILAIAEKNSQI